MKIFNFLIFYIFLTAFNPLFSEKLLLKDGSFFSGKLILLDIHGIVFQNEKGFIKINYGSIDFMIPDTVDENGIMVFIERKDESKAEYTLVKISDNVIFCTDKNIIFEINLNMIKSLSLGNSSAIDEKMIKVYRYTDEYSYSIDNFKSLINKLIIISGSSKEKTEYQEFDINDVDFYERFWNNINMLIKEKTKNLLWQLLIQYFDHEKNLNLIYTDLMQDSDVKNHEKINNELNDKIIRLRYDFYRRTLKIIHTNENSY